MATAVYGHRIRTNWKLDNLTIWRPFTLLWNFQEKFLKELKQNKRTVAAQTHLCWKCQITLKWWLWWQLLGWELWRRWWRLVWGDNYSAVRLGQEPWTALTLPPAYCFPVFRKYVISKMLMLVVMLMMIKYDEEWWKVFKRKTTKASINFPRSQCF